jgi:hypothetical protein
VEESTMLACLLALMLSPAPPILAPSAPMPIESTCFGPCHVPGCPGSTFRVCQGGTPGKTEVYGQNGGVKFSSLNDKDATYGVGVQGAIINPKAGKNWGTVAQCEDLEGFC